MVWNVFGSFILFQDMFEIVSSCLNLLLKLTRSFKLCAMLHLLHNRFQDVLVRFKLDEDVRNCFYMFEVVFLLFEVALDCFGLCRVLQIVQVFLCVVVVLVCAWPSLCVLRCLWRHM